MQTYYPRKAVSKYSPLHLRFTPVTNVFQYRFGGISHPLQKHFNIDNEYFVYLLLHTLYEPRLPNNNLKPDKRRKSGAKEGETQKNTGIFRKNDLENSPVTYCNAPKTHFETVFTAKTDIIPISTMCYKNMSMLIIN